MARKPTDIVQYKLRIRESLRRRIEQAAKKNGVSANQEMVSRLARSFEQETTRQLDFVAGDMTKQVGLLGTLSDHFREFEPKLVRFINEAKAVSELGRAVLEKSLRNKAGGKR